MDNRHIPKLVLGTLVLGFAIWLFASGAYRSIDPAAIRNALLSAGSWGAVAYVFAFAFVQPLGPSGHLFVIGASMVWAAPLAFGLSLVAAVLGQTLYFLFYRYLAYDWARSRIPARLRPYQRALIERPVRTVTILRLLTFTWPLAPIILGASGVRAKPMLLGTVLGLVPMVALDVWVGAGVVEWVLARFNP